MERPREVIFFPNGIAAVYDQHGRQMTRYQTGWHGTTIAALNADGIDWETIQEIHGVPLSRPPSWWIEQQNSPHDSILGQPLQEAITMERPACKTCPYFVLEHNFQPSYSACHYDPHVVPKTEDDFCSHHPGFPAYIASLRSPQRDSFAEEIRAWYRERRMQDAIKGFPDA